MHPAVTVGGHIPRRTPFESHLHSAELPSELGDVHDSGYPWNSLDQHVCSKNLIPCPDHDQYMSILEFPTCSLAGLWWDVSEAVWRWQITNMIEMNPIMHSYIVPDDHSEIWWVLPFRPGTQFIGTRHPTCQRLDTRSREHVKMLIFRYNQLKRC
jgi:hypothetical protein